MAIARWEMLMSAQQNCYLLKIRGDRSDVEKIINTHPDSCQSVQEIFDDVYQWAIFVVDASNAERLAIQNQVISLIEEQGSKPSSSLLEALEGLSGALENLTNLTADEHEFIMNKMARMSQMAPESGMRAAAPSSPPPTTGTGRESLVPPLGIPGAHPSTLPRVAVPPAVPSSPGFPGALPGGPGSIPKPGLPNPLSPSPGSPLPPPLMPPGIIRPAQPPKQRPGVGGFPIPGVPGAGAPKPPSSMPPAALPPVSMPPVSIPPVPKPVVPKTSVQPPPVTVPPAQVPRVPPPPPKPVEEKKTSEPMAKDTAPLVQPLASAPIQAPPPSQPAGTASGSAPAVTKKDDSSIFVSIFYPKDSESIKNQFISTLKDVAQKKSKKPIGFNVISSVPSPISLEKSSEWIKKSKMDGADIFFVMIPSGMGPEQMDPLIAEAQSEGLKCFIIPEPEVASKLLYMDLMVELLMFKKKPGGAS